GEYTRERLIDRDKNSGCTLAAELISPARKCRHVDLLIAEECCIAKHDPFAIDGAYGAFARRRVEAINPWDHDFPSLSCGNDRCRQWMLAGAFDARRQTQKIALVPAIMRHDGNHRGLSLGKRARLVDH